MRTPHANTTINAMRIFQAHKTHKRRAQSRRDKHLRGAAKSAPALAQSRGESLDLVSSLTTTVCMMMMSMAVVVDFHRCRCSSRCACEYDQAIMSIIPRTAPEPHGFNACRPRKVFAKQGAAGSELHAVRGRCVPIRQPFGGWSDSGTMATALHHTKNTSGA